MARPRALKASEEEAIVTAWMFYDKAQALTMDELAERFNVKRSTIQSVLRRHRRNRPELKRRYIDKSQ